LIEKSLTMKQFFWLCFLWLFCLFNSSDVPGFQSDGSLSLLIKAQHIVETKVPSRDFGQIPRYSSSRQSTGTIRPNCNPSPTRRNYRPPQQWRWNLANRCVSWKVDTTTYPMGILQYPWRWNSMGSTAMLLQYRKWRIVLLLQSEWYFDLF
jgi:hypothetical protein